MTRSPGKPLLPDETIDVLPLMPLSSVFASLLGYVYFAWYELIECAG